MTEEKTSEKVQGKKSNKKLIIIILGVIGCLGLLCVFALVAIFGLGALGLRKTQNAVTDTQVKSFMRDIERSIETYYSFNSDYPTDLKDVSFDYIIVDKEDYKIKGNTIEYKGYKIKYQIADEDKYLLSTTLSDGEDYYLGNAPIE